MPGATFSEVSGQRCAAFTSALLFLRGFCCPRKAPGFAWVLLLRDELGARLGSSRSPLRASLGQGASRGGGTGCPGVPAPETPLLPPPPRPRCCFYQARSSPGGCHSRAGPARRPRPAEAPRGPDRPAPAPGPARPGPRHPGGRRARPARSPRCSSPCGAGRGRAPAPAEKSSGSVRGESEEAGRAAPGAAQGRRLPRPPRGHLRRASRGGRARPRGAAGGGRARPAPPRPPPPGRELVLRRRGGLGRADSPRSSPPGRGGCSLLPPGPAGRGKNSSIMEIK